MSQDDIPTNQGYAAEAPALFKRYEARSSEAVHADWQHLFPHYPCRALDIGAGTGRDAAWLATKGCNVLAVEPTDELRRGAAEIHTEPQITWLDDALPDLRQTRALGETFELILIIAVWMHLDASQRSAAMPHVAALMSPGGRVFLMLRHGPIPKGRRMFEVAAKETVELAHKENLICLYNARAESVQSENRARDISWTKLVFEKPV